MLYLPISIATMILGVNDVLERKGIDTSNMTESEKVAKATGLNFKF